MLHHNMRIHDLIFIAALLINRNHPMEGIAIPQSKPLTHNFSCLKELQQWKWRRAQGKEGPMSDPKWDPAQGEVSRPDTITEAVEHPQ